MKSMKIFCMAEVMEYSVFGQKLPYKVISGLMVFKPLRIFFNYSLNRCFLASR